MIGNTLNDKSQRLDGRQQQIIIVIFSLWIGLDTVANEDIGNAPEMTKNDIGTFDATRSIDPQLLVN